MIERERAFTWPDPHSMGWRWRYDRGISFAGGAASSRREAVACCLRARAQFRKLDREMAASTGQTAWGLA